MNIIYRGIKYLKNYPIRKERQKRYASDKQKYIEMNKNTDNEFPMDEEFLFPILCEADQDAGFVDGHYFLQDIYFARKVNAAAPDVHYDIGSRVDGFIAHLLGGNSVKNVTLIDIRPFPVEVDGLTFIQSDAMKLQQFADDSIMSISSLHAIEHFGLGRYGDDINPDGWKNALHAIQRKLAKGGVFYLGLPLSKPQKLRFNADRLFEPLTVIHTLDKLQLESFAYIHEYKIYNYDIKYIEKVNDVISDIESDCGLFIFKKI